MKVFISKVIKSGTARTDRESDRGKVVHLIIGKEPNGYWDGLAICGSKLRRTSNGWHEHDKDVSCKKCLELLNDEPLNCT
jgi:hypothetical protein